MSGFSAELALREPLDQRARNAENVSLPARNNTLQAAFMLQSLEHDPEKWTPVFGKDHAPPIGQSGMTIRRKVITL